MDTISANVVQLLTEHGQYRLAASPLRIGEIDFAFDAILVGPGALDGLVIIADLQSHTSRLTLRRIRGLITLLDRIGSRRTVSVVLVMRVDVDVNIVELEKYCHVIIVRPDALLERSVRPLLPLDLPEAQEHHEDVMAALLYELGSDAENPLVHELFPAAQLSADAVEQSFRAALINAMERGGSGST